jgi:hypothetical protein
VALEIDKMILSPSLLIPFLAFRIIFIFQVKAGGKLELVIQFHFGQRALLEANQLDGSFLQLRSYESVDWISVFVCVLPVSYVYINMEL